MRKYTEYFITIYTPIKLWSYLWKAFNIDKLLESQARKVMLADVFPDLKDKE